MTGALTWPQHCRAGVTPGLVLAHGASHDLDHPLLMAVATHLAKTGTAAGSVPDMDLMLREFYALRELRSKNRVGSSTDPRQRQ